MQTLSVASKPRTKRRDLALGSVLSLLLGLGCDANGPQDAEDPSATPGMEVQAAPVLAAPEDVRIPDEYLVVFKDQASQEAIEAAVSGVSRAGGGNAVLYRYSVLAGFAARLDDAELDRIRHTRGVQYVEENQRVGLQASSASPADGIDRTDQRVGHDGLYDDHGREGEGVHVYVVDTGLNTQHSEFWGRVAGGFTAVTDGRGVEDCNGHGTHVSSTVAGSVHGMARKATLHPVRVLDCTGVGSWATAIAGVDFVRNDCSRHKGPCVANMSLGGSSNVTLNQAVSNAVDAGVTFVVAAGNENVDACTRSPAGVAKAITVAAIDDNDTRAGFSNWGSCVDLFAPGVTIEGAWWGGAKATQTLSGTSMASPHVAGVAAQYLGQYPQATPAQVEAGILSSVSIQCVADPKGSPNKLLFSDLDQGHYSCGASCQGHCGEPSEGCFCDPGCGIYGDCCADFAQVCQ
jgi:aqualysin 1